jgi:hypothetical protein
VSVDPEEVYLESEKATYLKEVESERLSMETVKALAHELAAAAVPLWGWGDGEGGWVREIIAEAFDDAGLSRSTTVTSTRKPLSAKVRRIVFERDGYRCRRCGGWLDLHVDHIVPVARGGTDDLENLQTLCRDCNIKKGIGP